MELFSAAGLLAIAKIIVIDILLAGDNAIVIGMAAKNLQEKHRKLAIFWGTFGAIALRLIMAFLFVEAINNIPGLRLVGGVLLLWIGYKLMAANESSHNIEAKSNLRDAIITIVIADGIMGIDNVIGVVGAAEGNMMLVLVGILITVPIIIWGSTMFIKLIEKYPVILFFGGGILGWIGGEMIHVDQYTFDYIDPISLPFKIACIILVVGAALIQRKLTAKKADHE
ncbi:MAG: TerC family protein [Veillonella sp.]|uniref:YjbE family putative metal transport protein n=1 Tax=Veillonella sp. TaxID=1926307 RepID=UPI0025CDA404|nr:YjbE family putative metal transport protein [Veillonella sp.]MBE6080110.1 TerC family protein [Veillonella sp.]